MEPVVIHTQHQVFRPRAMLSIGLTILGVWPFIFTHHLLAILDFLHPVRFLTSVVGGLFSMLLCWPVVAVIVFCTLAYRNPNYKVISEKLCCPADSIPLVLNVKAALQALVHSMSSFLLASLLTWMIGGRYQDLVVHCSSSSTRCLNEHKWFVVLFSSILGCVWSLELSAFSKNSLYFQSVEKPVFKKFQEIFPSLLKSATKMTRRVFFVYYPVYFILGESTAYMVRAFLFLHENEENSLRNWWSVVDVKLLYQTYILGVLISIIWSLSLFLFQACITKHVKFEMADAKSEGSLLAALELKQDSLTKMLALKDLWMLSKTFDDVRREKVFSLSNPGGHPKTWDTIRSATTSCLKELLARIETSNEQLVASYKSIMSHQAGKIETLKPGYNTPPKPAVSTSQTGKKWYYPSVLYRVYPNHLSAKIFYDTQKHVWSVSVLSNLITRSFSEDKYGIVQQNLGEIITLLTSLTQAMEKLFRAAPVLGKRVEGRPSDGSSHALGIELHTQLKSSLQSIATTFHPHINQICGLSSDSVKELQSYLN